MSLRARLVLLVLIAALPVLALEVFDRIRERGEERAAIAADAMRIAELKAEQAGRIVELARGITNTAAQLASVLDGDGETCSDDLSQILDEFPSFSGMAAIGLDGYTFCRNSGGPPIYVGDRTYFQRAVREQTFLSSGYLLARALQRPAMVFVAPVHDEAGKLRALVTVSYELSRLPSILANTPQPEGSTINLIDGDGYLLARIPQWSGETVDDAAAFLERISRAGRGASVATGLDGVERVYGYVPLPGPASLGVVVGLPLGPALARIDRLMWYDLGLFGAIFGVAALMALVGGELGIRRPLRQLQEVAGRVGSGQLSARSALGPSAVTEVEALATSLDEMAEAIATRETALAASEAFSRRMLESSRDCIKLLDLDGRVCAINSYGVAAMGVADASEVIGRRYLELWEEDVRPQAADTLARAREGGAARFLARTIRSGQESWWDVSVSAIPDASGRPERLLVVSRDMTELKRGEEQRGLLVAELDHRVKNTLAAVQSVARRTLGPGPSTQALLDRLDAMAKAHALLSRRRWEGSALTELLTTTLIAYGRRVVLDGPEVQLDPKATQSLGMIVHELATNAAKYGALSQLQGHVRLSWSLDADGRRQLTMVWTERGGPPAEPPAHKGFGLTFLERSVEHEFGGSARFDFLPEGFTCTLALPLAPGEYPLAPAPGHAIPPGAPVRGSGDLAGRRVLVVEDAALLAMEAQDTLEDAGARVIGPAATLGEALRLARAERPDAAVLDVNLGGGDTSFPVAEELRAQGVPFLFVTGYNSRAIFPDTFADTPRLAKPYRERDLLAALARLLEEGPARRPERPQELPRAAS